ncbi:MAG TPA: hypothetical protein VKL99_03275 [Candidatus Angelobacter sp.]|nr:MAG: hypothetical protein DMG65_13740 [Candidatus Angelobacter sp. Gp1-AA117]HMC29829.1 hypothetical protein [Candidatus Angelobacter sp.]
MHDDIRGVERCPSTIEDYLLSIGGQTPFGGPMWRLVLARNVIWKVAGGKVWDERLSLAERGGFDFSKGIPHENRPLRDESDRLVEQRRYPHIEGWILQRWFPASAYSKAQWFAPENCLPDGTPKLGPFPECGDYETAGGPVERVPGKQELYEFISRYYQQLESRKGSVEARIREAVNAAEYERQRQEKRMRVFADEYVQDKCSYLQSSSLEAGRIREQVARRCGIREHVGN